MRKALLFAMSLALVFTSCSSDENKSLQGELLTKMVLKGENVSLDYKNYDFNFFYSNNKILRVEREGKLSREFTYSGNLISEIKDYVFWNLESEPTLESTIYFEYNNLNKLIKVTIVNEDTNVIKYEYLLDYISENVANYQIKIYTWPGDNNLFSIGQVTFDVNTKNILNKTITYYNQYLDQNGNPVPVTPSSKIQYFYDTKMHPCSNIEGFKELAFFNLNYEDTKFFTSNFGVTNNLLRTETHNLNTPNNIIVRDIWSYENGDIFPVTAKKNNIDFRAYFYY